MHCTHAAIYAYTIVHSEFCFFDSDLIHFLNVSCTQDCSHLTVNIFKLIILPWWFKLSLNTSLQFKLFFILKTKRCILQTQQNTKWPFIGLCSKLQVRSTDPPRKSHLFMLLWRSIYIHQLSGALHWTVEVFRRFDEQPLCSAPCEWLSVLRWLASTRLLFNWMHPSH